MSNDSAHTLLLNAYKMILQAYELMGYKTQEDDNFKRDRRAGGQGGAGDGAPGRRGQAGDR